MTLNSIVIQKRGPVCWRPCGWITVIHLLVGLCVIPAVGQAQSVTVSTVSELRQAIDAANSAGGGTAIRVMPGVYTLTSGLWISAPGITLESTSGNPLDTVIEGDAMRSDAAVGNVLTIAADGFVLDGITLQKSRYHLVQIKGESDADAPSLRNCILRDAYEQLVKVSVDLDNTAISSDGGVVENCLFEYSAGIGPQYYIGGIDAHSSRNWIVRNNTFRNIVSPSQSVAQYAIHFWNDSADNLVESNLIVDCDRGIGFGLSSRGNTGGLIRNNMIYHSGFGTFADVGIAIHNSPGSRIYHNTVIMQGSYPNAIEYRFSGTTNAEIVNNLTNRSIRQLDGASAALSGNITTANVAWFVSAAEGDLHLVPGVTEVIDQGVGLSDVTVDYDGDQRPQGQQSDIGADEFVSLIRPRPPTDLSAT